MKNLLLLLAFVLGGVVVSVAQSDANSAVTVNMDAVEMAEKAAMADDSIEKKVCSKSGEVSYYKTSVCPASGKVSAEPVQWDEAKATFVSTKMEAGDSAKKSCSKSKKECSKSKKECSAKAMKTSASGKSCSKKCEKKCSKSSSAMKAEAKSDVNTLKASSSI